MSGQELTPRSQFVIKGGQELQQELNCSRDLPIFLQHTGPPPQDGILHRGLDPPTYMVNEENAPHPWRQVVWWRRSWLCFPLPWCPWLVLSWQTKQNNQQTKTKDDDEIKGKLNFCSKILSPSRSFHILLGSLFVSSVAFWDLKYWKNPTVSSLAMDRSIRIHSTEKWAPPDQSYFTVQYVF